MTSKLEDKVDSILSPIQAFVRDETVSSVILFSATVLALVLANSRYADSYFSLIHLPVSLGVASLELEFDLHYVVNDGLMSLFFLVLGLEIKRELLVGELQNPALAVTVVAAALGGMLCPALIYSLVNLGAETANGWGVPVATDSAFALGVLLLLGSRMPAGLKAFLVAFAILDDLGAILVIALFYTDSLQPEYVGAAAACLCLLVACNFAGMRHISIYLALGLVLWGAVVAAGVHGTVAGVLVAATVPARPKHGRKWFVRQTRQLARRVEKMHARQGEEGILADPEQHDTVAAAEAVAKSASTPLRRWERSLERPVLLLVLPLFALANAGIPVSAQLLDTVLDSPAAWGIALGLLVGKVTGISLLTWCSVRTGYGKLPQGVGMSHVVGVALLGGMGFTMSIFIADLSFSDDEVLDAAKIAILAASALAGALGYLCLRFVPRRTHDSS